MLAMCEVLQKFYSCIEYFVDISATANLYRVTQLEGKMMMTTA